MRISLVGALVLVTASLIVCWAWPPAAGPAMSIPPEIVAFAQGTRMGGEFMLEVDATGKILSYSADVDVDKVPEVCLAAAEKAAPGGKVIGAEREVIGGTSYWEIEKEIDGLKQELLFTEDGKLAGSEKALRDPPAEVVKAANDLLPEGKVVVVELVEGPETLGSPEHHVKKDIKGELVRIRVTGKGALEQLRKLRTEVRVPPKK